MRNFFSDAGCLSKFQRSIFYIIYNPYAVLFVIACILLNTLFMALDHHDMSPELSKILLFGNYVSIHRPTSICCYLYNNTNICIFLQHAKRRTPQILFFYQIDVGRKRLKAKRINQIVERTQKKRNHLRY